MTLAFAATLLAMEVVLLVSGHRYWREILLNQIRAHLTAVAASRREMAEAGIKLLRQQATLHTQRAEFRRFLATAPGDTPAEIDRTNSQNRLDKIVDGKTVFSASLVGQSGKILLSSNSEKVENDLSAEPVFRRGLLDSYVALPRRVDDHLELTIAAPVRTRGMTVGVLVMSADVASLAEPLQDITGLGKSGEVMLLLRDDHLVRYVLPPRQRMDISSVPADEAPALAGLLGAGGTFTEMTDYRGRLALAAGSATDYEGWFVVAKADEAEAYEPINRALRMRILYGLLVAAAGSIAVYFVARSFALPLQRLSDAAARVASGDYQGPVPITSGDEIGALSASFNEMTAAIRARGVERDLAEAALRLAHQRKDDFLAILGHELRNPVSAIAAGVTMWKEAENDSATVKDVQEVIDRQTGNLKRLVDDLLDVARITTGKVELRKVPLRVTEIVGQAVDAIRPLVANRHHRIEVNIESAASVWIDADPTRIEQVLSNLLTNAVKYTPDGGRIAVTARVDGDEIEISVRDNGIGLASDALGHIFELFTQTDTSLHRTSGGLGIGLSLSRQLIELHGGTLLARSEGLHCGAEFIVRLPAVSAPILVEGPAPAPSLHGTPRRVLLVDDNEDTIRLLSQLLERRGHQVSVAYDGLTGLEAAQNFRPDVFILDIGLPGIDGYELARRLRTEGFAEVLIIAMSGYAQEGDRARSREAGFDHHFAKPVDVDSLAQLIAVPSTSESKG